MTSVRETFQMPSLSIGNGRSHPILILFHGKRQQLPPPARTLQDMDKDNSEYIQRGGKAHGESKDCRSPRLANPLVYCFVLCGDGQVWNRATLQLVVFPPLRKTNALKLGLVGSARATDRNSSTAP